MDAAARHPEYSFFGSRMLMADAPDLLDGVGDVYHVSGLHWREGHGQRAKESYSHEKEIFAPCAAAALYRRHIFLEAGGFDEDYFCYAEDIDLGFRLRLLGHRCLYVPDAVVHHNRIGIDGHAQRLLHLPRAPESGLGLCEEHAGATVLALSSISHSGKCGLHCLVLG